MVQDARATGEEVAVVRDARSAEKEAVLRDGDYYDYEVGLPPVGGADYYDYNYYPFQETRKTEEKVAVIRDARATGEEVAANQDEEVNVFHCQQLSKK